MLPSSALDLILNPADKRAAGLLALSGSSVVAGVSPASSRIIRADTRLARVRVCRPNLSGERAFDDIDLSAKTVRLALGVPGQNPYCLATLADPFPAAASVISAVQSATADLPATKRITLDPAPYAGTWLLTLDGNDPIELPFDAEPGQIQSLAGPNYTVRKRAANAWEISGTEPSQDVTIAVDVTGLLVPKGVTGPIALNTVALAAYFAAQASGTPPSEPKWLPVIREVTIDGEPVFQDEVASVKLAREILNLTSLVPAPIPPSDYASLSALIDGKQPLNSQLSALSSLVTTAPGRALLTKVDQAAILAYLSGQPLNSQLSAIALLVTAVYGRSLLTASSPAAAQTLLLLDQIDNTHDADKPVSTAQALADEAVAESAATDLAAAVADLLIALAGKVATTGDEDIAGIKTFSSPPVVPSDSFPQAAIASLVTDLAAKAPLASPALTGTPTVPTAAAGIASTQAASTAFVHDVIALLLNAPPSTLDTLKELADALGDDPNFATTVATSIATKLAKAANLSDLTDAAAARANLALGNVNNTSDANKPVSTAQALADVAVADAAAAALIAALANLLAVDSTFTGENIFTFLQTFNSIASRSLAATQLANPGAPTVTPIGSDEGATWSYKIVALLSDGTPSAAGPAGTTTHGDQTLDLTNRISLSWTAVPGAASYDVYRTAHGVSPATNGKIANVPTNAYVDTGAPGDSSTPPTVNSTGSVTAALVTAASVAADDLEIAANFTPPASTLAALGSASPAGRIKRLTDGPAAGGIVKSDGTSWRGLIYIPRKIIHPVEPPYNTPNDDTGDAAIGINAAYAAAAALNARVEITEGIYRIASAITHPAGVHVEAAHWAADRAGDTAGTEVTAPLNGAWFHVAGNSFFPIRFIGPGQSSLRGLGIYHDQPVPGAGWAPTIYPYTINLTSCRDVILEELMLLNPSHGIRQESDPNDLGRLTINNLFMHAFVEGLHLNNVTDTSRFTNFHLWPFYSARIELRDYTRAHATGIYLAGTENPQFVNIFGFALDSLFVLEAPMDGHATTKVRVVNADADNSNRLALLKGGGVSDWVACRGGGGTDVAAALVEVQGIGNNAIFLSLRGDQLPAQLLKVTGHSNDVKILGGDVFNVGAGVYAIENSPDVANGNTVSVDNLTFTGANAANKFGGTEPWNTNRTNVDGIGTPVRGCNIYHNIAQSIAASGVSQALIFNASRQDTDAEHSTVTNPDRITFKKAGWRSIQASIEWAAAPNGVRELWVEHYNAAGVLQGILTDTGRQLSIITSPGVGITMVQSTPARVFFAASGDYLKIWVNQTSGGALNVNYAPKYSPEVTCVWQGT